MSVELSHGFCPFGSLLTPFLKGFLVIHQLIPVLYLFFPRGFEEEQIEMEQLAFICPLLVQSDSKGSHGKVTALDGCYWPLIATGHL